MRVAFIYMCNTFSDQHFAEKIDKNLASEVCIDTYKSGSIILVTDCLYSMQMYITCCWTLLHM